MKNLLFLAGLLTFQAHAKIICQSTGRPYRCYENLIILELNEKENTFHYSSEFQVGSRFCGWPPAGYSFKGEIRKQQGTFLLIGDKGESAELFIKDGQGVYTGAPESMLMACED